MHQVFANLFSDFLLWLSLLVQFALTLLGAIIAIKEEWAKNHQKSVILLFVVLGVAGMGITAKQAFKGSADSTNLSNALTNLRTSTQEISRITSLNTDLQQTLLTQGKTLTDLAKQNIASVTGGDSFCWMLVGQRDNSSPQISVTQHGQYAVHGVTARLVDIQKFNRLTRGQPLTLDNVLVADTNYAIGDLSVHSGRMLGTLLLNNEPGDRRDFNILFNGINGYWTELLRLRRVDGKWLQAVKVKREIINGNHMTEKDIFQQIDTGFPMLNKNDW